MPGTPDNAGAATLLSVGHSNHPLDAFLDLLARHRVALVVDVRSSPYSAYTPHFNREALGQALQARGLAYEFLGDRLGGRPQAERFYDERGYVCYDRVAASPEFQTGIERLIELARMARAALLCGEEDPTDCHRRRLLGPVLQRHGIALVHIRADGRLQDEDEVAREDWFRKTKGQRSLFGEEEPGPWKSTQSVSPRRPPPSSSDP